MIAKRPGRNLICPKNPKRKEKVLLDVVRGQSGPGSYMSLYV